MPRIEKQTAMMNSPSLQYGPVIIKGDSKHVTRVAKSGCHFCRHMQDYIINYLPRLTHGWEHTPHGSEIPRKSIKLRGVFREQAAD